MWWERTGIENLADFLPRLGSIAAVFECIYLDRPIWQSWLIEALQWRPPWLKVDAQEPGQTNQNPTRMWMVAISCVVPAKIRRRSRLEKIPNMLTYTNLPSTVHYSVGRTIWIRDTRPGGRPWLEQLPIHFWSSSVRVRVANVQAHYYQSICLCNYAIQKKIGPWKSLFLVSSLFLSICLFLSGLLSLLLSLFLSSRGSKFLFLSLFCCLCLPVSCFVSIELSQQSKDAVPSLKLSLMGAAIGIFARLSHGRHGCNTGIASSALSSPALAS